MKSSGISKIFLAIALFTLPWLSHGISCSSRYYCVTEEVKYISMEEIPGAHLNTTAIKKHAVKSVPQCQQFCVKEDKCRSINLIGNKTNGYDCHLLDLNKFSNSTLVVMNETFSHLYIPSKCSEIPCKNGGVCVPEYLNDSYVCECKSNGSWISRGKHCELVLSGYKSAHVYYSINDNTVMPPNTDTIWVTDRKSRVAICHNSGFSCSEFISGTPCLNEFTSCKPTVTYSIWVKFQKGQVGKGTNIIRTKHGNRPGLKFISNKDGYHIIGAISTKKRWEILSFGKWVDQTKWNQFTFAIDDNSIACAYINGAKEKCETVPTVVNLFQGSNPVRIGGFWSAKSEPSMYYDDFAIWQVAFTADEAMNLYNSSKD